MDEAGSNRFCQSPIYAGTQGWTVVVFPLPYLPYTHRFHHIRFQLDSGRKPSRDIRNWTTVMVESMI
eukprot:gene25857-biopygen9515